MANIEMKDVKPSLDLTSLDVTSYDDIRSPRTPIYKPTSPSFTNLAPFDSTKLFANLTTPQIKITPPQLRILPPKPSDPLAWVWQCHLCHSRWPIGVTRRCLVDGHLYCSGETDQPTSKKKEKGQSCSSEFDYVDWKDYGVWRREALKLMENPRVLKGCERCEFPSQCRYVPSVTTIIDDRPSTSPMKGVEYTSPDGSIDEDDLSQYYSTGNVTFESLLERVASASKKSQSKMTDCYRPDRKRSKSEGRRLSPSDKITKGASEKCTSNKSLSLAPIEEEGSRSETSLGLQGLVMPMLEFWNEKGKRMSFP